MSVRAWGQLFVQLTAPAEDPVQVGSLWSDTTASLLKRCTAVAPYTWVSTEGGSSVVAAALTKVDDTNVTLTLGGTPLTSLLQAVSLTLGWTGILAVLRGGTGVTTSTGSGNNVLSTSPVLVTPNLGTPSAGVATSLTGLPLTSGVTGVLPIANGGTNVAALLPIAYTPTTTGLTLGNGTIVGSYLQIGKLVLWQVRLTFGSTTSLTGTMFIGVPVSAQDIRAISGNCTGWYFDSSANTSYQANMVSVDVDKVLPTIYGGASALSGNSPISSTTPFTWAVSDEVNMGGCFFAA